MSDSHVLVLDGLGKDFGGTAALDALTATIASGEIVGLLGPNGAGKTTTMKLVLGLLRPSRGSARLFGMDCTERAQDVKRHLGYSPDEPAFYDFLTGRETVDFVLNIRDRSIPETWAKLGPIVTQLDFESSLDQATGSYSHGTKKKLALLLALAHDPELLLLDEPTNGLDPPTAARVRTLLRDRAKAGAAIVVSTHLLGMAELLCDRVLVLHKGKLVAEGPTKRIAGDASLEDAFLALVK